MNGKTMFNRLSTKGRSTWYTMVCPLKSRYPLFGVSAKRGFTVFVSPSIFISLSVQSLTRVITHEHAGRWFKLIVKLPKDMMLAIPHRNVFFIYYESIYFQRLG